METTKRIVALDAFRGLTVAMMILVNTPGSWAYVYPPLDHAKWHGCTPTDLVFPFFLFIVGTAMWFSFKSFNHQLSSKAVRKIIKRTLIIFLIGTAMKLYSMLLRDNTHFRVMGVLQRIALAYGFASFLVLSMKKRNIMITSAFILFAYWFLLWFFGGENPYSLETNIVRTIDLKVIGAAFLYKGEGIPFDPEGLLSTLPAIVTVVIGYLTGYFIDSMNNRNKLVVRMFGIGIILVVAGLVWNEFFPINKKLWTSSYVLYTAGLAQIFLSFFIWIIDIKGFKKWVQPLVWFGMNPLFIYVMSIVLAITYLGIHIDGMIMYAWLYKKVFVAIAGNMNGSLLFALFHVMLFGFIGRIMYQKKIFIKI
jgi:predicted acyltransferase